MSYLPADGVLHPDVIPHLKVSQFLESLWCCIVVVSQLTSFKAVLEVFRSCDKRKSADCQKTSPLPVSYKVPHVGRGLLLVVWL